LSIFSAPESTPSLDADGESTSAAVNWRSTPTTPTSPCASERISFDVAPAAAFSGTGYDLMAMLDCSHDLGDPVGATRRVHGFDATQPPPGEPPEILADWADDAVTTRKRGLAFCAPVIALNSTRSAPSVVMRPKAITMLAATGRSHR
jgi:hypothetical protein